MFLKGSSLLSQVGWLCLVIFTKILSARCRASGRPSQAGEAIWALCHKVRSSDYKRKTGGPRKRYSRGKKDFIEVEELQFLKMFCFFL